ncbi:hypothetical protein ACHAXA_007419 [Cyclostephanos tholiformis]|uniref:HSF-type DNA-binding domain-containing protein n=1 Tax=Cyclostephanos tholiformis TaxID=382380 RepID=A0ABD3SDL3_9STRA
MPEQNEEDLPPPPSPVEDKDDDGGNAEITITRGEDENVDIGAPAAIRDDDEDDGADDARGGTTGGAETKTEAETEAEAETDADPHLLPPEAPAVADPPPPARKKNVPPMVHRSAVRDQAAKSSSSSSTNPAYPTQEAASSSAPDDDPPSRRPMRIDTSFGVPPTVHEAGRGGGGVPPSTAPATAPAADDGIRRGGDEDASAAPNAEGDGEASPPPTDAKRRGGKGSVPSALAPIAIPPGLPSDEQTNRTWSETIFPMKLYDILCNPQFHYAISWMSHGRSWKVLNKDYFMEEICPRYFAQTRYESFVRQVNGWGFKRMRREGSDRGSYYHEHFLRGYPNMIDHMRRPAPGEKSRDMREEPDFYTMPSMPPLPPGDANRMGRIMAAAMAYQNQVKKVGRPTGSARGGGRGPPTSPRMTSHHPYGPPGIGPEGGSTVGPGGGSSGGHHVLPPLMPPPMHGYPPHGPGGYGPPPPQAYMPFPGGAHMAMVPYDGMLSPGGAYGPPPTMGYYPPMPNYGPGSPWRHPDTPSGGGEGGWPPSGHPPPPGKSPGDGGPPGALDLHHPPPGNYPPPMGYPYWDPQLAMPPPSTPGSRGSFRFSTDQMPTAGGTKRDREIDDEDGGGAGEKADGQGRRQKNQFSLPRGAHPSMGPPGTPGGGMWYHHLQGGPPMLSMMMQQQHPFAAQGRAGGELGGTPQMSGGGGGDGDEDIGEPKRYPGH